MLRESFTDSRLYNPGQCVDPRKIDIELKKGGVEREGGKRGCRLNKGGDLTLL